MSCNSEVINAEVPPASWQFLPAEGTSTKLWATGAFLGSNRLAKVLLAKANRFNFASQLLVCSV